MKKNVKMEFSVCNLSALSAHLLTLLILGQKWRKSEQASQIFVCSPVRFVCSPVAWGRADSEGVSRQRADNSLLYLNAF